MMFLFHRKPESELHRTARSGMLSFGLLSLLFGIAIYAAPELLAYLVGGFFILIGVSVLLTWWNSRP